MSDRASVQVGNVTIPLWLHQKGWRFGYQTKAGGWKYITRVDKTEAIEKAREKAREINNGAADLSSVSQAQAGILQRVIEMGITHADLDDWDAARKRPKKQVDEAVTEFLNLKKANRGRSLRNTKSLSGDLGSLSKALGKSQLASVGVSDLEKWLATFEDISPRRRRNLRGSSVTFFKWARKRGYVPDKTTAAELLERPIVGRGVPATWSSEEMRLILDACPEEYIPWLVLSAFSGLRLEELFTDPKSDKSPLDWSDFHWNRDLIIVRPETAKTGERRVIPILPIARAWLFALRKPKGRVCPPVPPWKVHKRAPSINTLISGPVGGWRPNALRHSFISYRAAHVGLAQTAMEAGNSESEARRSYNDAKGKDEANAWFALMPKT